MTREPGSRSDLALAVVLGFGTLGNAASAQEVESARLDPVVITATRTGVAPFDLPVSIDRLGADDIRDRRLQVNISESLGAVPGVIARDRQNYAQDVQISVRGFGARSTFGIRGVRLYVDGIPATLPDGQGQISNVDLGSADRMEILRGPFSALYGNSSGGVIQVFTEDGHEPALTLGAAAAGGSWGTRRYGLKANGASGSLGYVVSASEFTIDGYRDHAAARRDIGNAKLTWGGGNAGKLTLVINSVALPLAQDPLGLTRAQFDANPRGVDPSAIQFDTRKTVDQTQVGVIYELAFGPVHSLRALVYDGHRNTEQFQAIPVGPQANPLHPGGVIVLGRDYQGVDLRWTVNLGTADRPANIVAGFSYDNLDEHRQGYQNFIGATTGVQGALRRDEDNRVHNSDPYVQGTWRFAERWSASAGIRRSSVSFSSTDHYIVGANPDDSGSTSYSANLPVAALMFDASDVLHLYASAGRGFETPTLNELAYRPNGQTGLNFALQAARSNSYEVGLKVRDATLGQGTLAVFETHTSNEIVTQTNVGGRSTYQNAGTTRRRGLEAWYGRDLPADLKVQAAYTFISARYRDAFLTCTATPCATPNVLVASGNFIPGIPRQSFYAGLSWEPPSGWRARVEFRALSKVYVNDVNSDAAAGYAIASADVGYSTRVKDWNLGAFARVDNAFNRKYAGSVIVNEGNARYFEPAPTSTWIFGMSASYAFR
jgi:iron complex outermembrane receptor protein